MDLRNEFPLMFYINLDRQEERRFRMEDEFDRHGLSVERVPAVNARYVRKRRGFRSQKSRARALSQRIVLRKARHRNAKAVLIFEDDLVFHPSFEERLKQIHLPEDWGILYLGCLHIECPKPVAPGIVRVKRAYSTHAMAIRAPYFAEVQRTLKQGKPKDGNLTNNDSFAIDTLLAELHIAIPTYAVWPDLVWLQPKPEGNRWVAAAERGEEDDPEESIEGLRESMLNLWRNVNDNASPSELPAPWPELYRYRTADDTPTRTLFDEEYEFLVRFSSLNGIRRVLQFGTGDSTRAFIENDADVFVRECYDNLLQRAKEQFAPYPEVTILRYSARPGLGMEGIHLTADLACINPLPKSHDGARISDLLSYSRERVSIILMNFDAWEPSELREALRHPDWSPWKVCEANQWLIISQKSVKLP